MTHPAIHSGERERRKGEVDAWARWRLGRGLTLFAQEISPTDGSVFEMMSPGCAVSAEAMRRATEEVSGLRRTAVEPLGLSAALHLEGRWALFIPDAALFCQLAFDPGFVDEAAAPAWDLWVDVIEVDAWE